MSGSLLTLCIITIPLLPMLVFAAGADGNDDVRRERMVRRQIEARGITDERVLDAMRTIPRHFFVPESQAGKAYDDMPLPIGHGQTISQPYIVAFMTEALHLTGDERVLEIGTGSGYQAAVLSRLAAEVYSIEIIPELGNEARETLERLGFDNVRVRIGDGYEGWAEHAPFDRIIVTCAPEAIPDALVSQLAEGGSMIIPVGPVYGVQELVVVEKRNGNIRRRNVLPVRFVPMIEGKDAQ